MFFGTFWDCQVHLKNSETFENACVGITAKWNEHSYRVTGHIWLQVSREKLWDRLTTLMKLTKMSNQNFFLCFSYTSVV